VPLHRCGARLINGGDVVPRSRRDGVDLAGRRRGRIGVGALNPARARAPLSFPRAVFPAFAFYYRCALCWRGVFRPTDRPTDLLIWSSSSTRIRVRLQFSREGKHSLDATESSNLLLVDTKIASMFVGETVTKASRGKKLYARGQNGKRLLTGPTGRSVGQNCNSSSSSGRGRWV
jgi:hypothetical protein